MGTYREDHQHGRHSNREFAHGETQDELTTDDLKKVEAQLLKLRRQVSLEDHEAIEAVVVETEEALFRILNRKDDGSLPEVVISLKAEIADARENFLR